MAEPKHEPQTREEIEAYFRYLLACDEADTGLYNLGIGYVVVDRIGPESEITFQWFDEALNFDSLIGKKNL